MTVKQGTKQRVLLYKKRDDCKARYEAKSADILQER